MKRLVLTIAIVIGLAAPAWAGFAEGVAAYARGDYATALREYRPLAGQGLAEAQYNLALMYDLGQGVPQDYAEAFKWFRKAAEQGLAEAQTNLGGMYGKGQGVPQDYAEAASWFRKAAEQGNATAQSRLGLMYDLGQGIPQDYAEAVKWSRKAAEQGLAGAQNNLGTMYGEGRGVPQDYVQAYFWLNLAASRSPPGTNRTNAVKSRGIVAEKMTPAQIVEAQRLAQEWFEKRGAPKGNDPLVSQPPKALLAKIQRGLAALGYDPGPADGILGPRTSTAIRTFQPDNALPVTGNDWELLRAQVTAAIKSRDKSIDKFVDAHRALDRGDYSTALRKLKPLAQQGLDLAQAMLGGMYADGLGVEQDYAKATSWLRKAADQGLAAGQHALGKIYDLGLGVSQDYPEAGKWYRKAADQDHITAQRSLGLMYYDGSGVPQDYAKALEWYRKAAEQGDALSQMAVGNMYALGPALGPGVPRDYVQAYMWYSLAASKLQPGKARDLAVEGLEALEAATPVVTPAQIAEAQRLAREWKPKK